MPSSPRKKASARKRPGKSTRSRQATPPLQTPIGAILTFGCLWLGILLFLALVSYTKEDIPPWVKFLSYENPPNDPAHNLLGVIGAIVAGFHYFMFGAGSYLLAVGFCWFGLARFVAPIPINQRTIGGLVLFVFAGASLAHLQPVLFQDWASTYGIYGPGGSVGGLFGDGFRRYIGTFGAQLILGTAYLLGLVLLTGFHPVTFFNRCQRAWEAFMKTRRGRVALAGEASAFSDDDYEETSPKPKRKRAAKKSKSASVDENNAEGEEEEWVVVAQNEAPPEAVIDGSSTDPANAETEASDETEAAAAEEEPPVPEELEPPKRKIIDGSARRPKAPKRDAADMTLPTRVTFQGVTFENYKLPPLDLLNFDEADPDAAPADESFLIRNQNIIVETLSTFGLEVYPGDITRGPSITRYEIYPSKGLRVSRIATLEPDIARATKAERINIIAPIPGKDTVGIEIANKDKVPVPLRELLDDPAFRDTDYRIPLALGKDVYGNAVLADLAQMPHLLVAGATGSGKSVCINSIIASLLFQFSPEQLRFIMIDPKVVEMQIYNDLPHLVVPVVTDPKKVILALRWVVKEMERRYQLFAKTGKRNFDAFNARDRDKPVRKPNRAPSRKRTDSPVATNKPKEEEPLKAAADPAETQPELDLSEEMATPVTEEAPNELALQSTATDSDDEENPPFFIQPVNLDGGDPAPLEDAEAEVLDDEDAEADDDGDAFDNEDEDLPPHEFATPEEPEIPDTLPYIVVIIDELADLMQTAPADVELAIGRITQMARAAGIHLIVATQTPRADVVTGTIKANIPCRIAFQVASGIDSRVILDAKGADRLVGKGDMLYLPPGTGQLVRAQGALVSDEEIQDLVEHCRKQGDPVYEQEVQETLEGRSQSESNVSDEDEEILSKCLEVIRQERRASTSLMQRRLGLGYTRAARMMDILEDRGYVGPGEGAKPREILMDFEEESPNY